MDATDLRRLFRYDRWANRKVEQEVANLASAPPKSVKRVGHILGAEAVWLARLTRQSAPLPVWPELSITDLLLQLDVMERAWQEFVDGLDDPALESQCEYVNTKGERFVSTVADVLMHVVMHSAYHRGQIAADIRASGSEPVNTDFIQAARQGYLD
ncbi:MAG TPA: DinB family protein [Candidatus Binatia bacterium]|nr:DinB family protein [Candidatus Binatia bacterium]